MDLPPLVPAHETRNPGHPTLHLWGESRALGRAHLYTLGLRPGPRGNGQTGLRFVIRLDQDGAIIGALRDLAVEPAQANRGLARHLVTMALELNAGCRHWVVRNVCGDGLTFWPHVCNELQQAHGVTFDIQPIDWDRDPE